MGDRLAPSVRGRQSNGPTSTMGAIMDNYRVLGLANGEWIVLTAAATIESAEVTAAGYRSRGWTVQVIAG